MSTREQAQRYMLCANLGTTAQVGLNMVTLQSGTVVVLYDDHIKALADARRAVWEEAAQMAEDLSADCLFKPDLDTSRIVERFAVTLRAQAQAKEGA